MNGIDKITSRVIADAEAEAAAKTAEAEERVRALKQRSDAAAAALTQKLAAESKTEADSAAALILSSAETQAKKDLLAMKQQLIGEVFKLAVVKLCALDGDKYTAFLASLAANACEAGTEEIILNERDRSLYGEAITRTANLQSGKSMTLSAETRPIIGGLILSQGNIEVNCALDTIAALRKNELSADIAGLLFT